MLTISRNERSFFTIFLDEEGELYCVPLYEEYLNDPNKYDYKKYGVHYFDYDAGTSETELWHHVSCTVDSKQKEMIGSLYQQRNEYFFDEFGYLTHTKDFDTSFRMEMVNSWDMFRVQLNGDIYAGLDGQPNKDGMAGIFFADVRIWNKARTWQQVKDSRQVILDLNQEKDNLIHNTQFLSGGRSYNAEPDLARTRYEWLNIRSNMAGDNPFVFNTTFNGA